MSNRSHACPFLRDLLPVLGRCTVAGFCHRVQPVAADLWRPVKAIDIDIAMCSEPSKVESTMGETVEAAAFAAGRQRWPEVGLTVDDFERHCLRLRSANRADWAVLYWEDLYLAIACALGDESAIEVVHREYLGSARKAIARLDSSKPFVDEVIQLLGDKLFVGPRPRIESYGARGPLRAWLSVAATRLALDCLRRRASMPKAKELPEYLTSPAANPMHAVLKARYAAPFQEALSQALAALSERERNVLRLHFVSRCSIDQIGAVYHVHRATAARWLRGCRESIFASVRRAMQAQCHLSGSEFLSVARGMQSCMDLEMSKWLGSATARAAPDLKT